MHRIFFHPDPRIIPGKLVKHKKKSSVPCVLRTFCLLVIDPYSQHLWISFQLFHSQLPPLLSFPHGHITNIYIYIYISKCTVVWQMSRVHSETFTWNQNIYLARVTLGAPYIAVFLTHTFIPNLRGLCLISCWKTKRCKMTNSLLFSRLQTVCRISHRPIFCCIMLFDFTVLFKSF